MDTEPGELPAELVTVDQIVALNLRHWRRVAGLTQDELGRRLGWSAANVSAAERSAAEGRERRRFDAQAMTEMALALGVPLTALFLPPEDDTISARYVITGTHGRERSMAEFTELCVMPDSDEDTEVMNGYRTRFNAAMTRYLSPGWAAKAAGYLRDVLRPETFRELAARLRDRERELQGAAAEFRELYEAIAREAE